MSPTTAFEKTRAAFARMQHLFGRPVFDEWLVVTVAGTRGAILAYEGPRREGFASQLRGDLRQLRNEIEKEGGAPGAFGFAREADGTLFDAFIILGPATYLLCNNTASSVRELSDDPLWRKAQVPFADLAEAFRNDPIVVPAPACVV